MAVGDRSLTDTDVNQLIQEMSAFGFKDGVDMNPAKGIVQNDDLIAIVAENWQKNSV